MAPPPTLFSNIIHDTINDKQIFDSYSLLNNLQDLLKIFPQNFEISTNNGKYKFNKDLVEFLIPNIKEALQENEYLKEYHFDIDDEQNVMQKIENLFQGESVEFLNSEENTIKQITSFFENMTFPLQMFSTEKLSQNKRYIFNTNPSDNQGKFPERMMIKINLKVLINILRYLPGKFKIKTNQNEYLCSSLGVFASKTISTFLESHPTATEYYFDFNEENRELEPIINLFNWGRLQFTPNNANQILTISENLGITSLSSLLNTYIQNIDEITNLIDPYDELFNNLFNIKKNGTGKVAEFIEKSEWAATKNDVQELAGCFLIAAKTNESIIAQLAELVQILSGSHQGSLSELLPFLTNHLFSDLRENSAHICAFLYHMSLHNLVSIDTIFNKISICNKPSHYHPQSTVVYWFLPEIIDKKILSHDIILKLISDVLSTEIDSDDKVRESVSKIRIMRDNCGQTDELIKSIKNDDIDSFQSIVSHTSIDVHKEKLKMSFYDELENQISFINYSAFCGSLKCFKYLFLEKVPIDSTTFCYAVRGGNVEIIHILDQNKDKFLKSEYDNEFYDKTESIIMSVQYHRNDIFDWLIENSENSENENLMDDLDILTLEIFKSAVSCGNAHAILRCLDKGLSISSIEIDIMCDLIMSTCTSGLYRLLLFINKLFPFSNIFNPTKYEKEEGESNITIIKDKFVELINASTKFGNIKIFDLLFESMKTKYSAVFNKVLIEAAKSGNIELVKHFIDDKICELSDFYLVQVICGAIESGFDELIDYFIGQNKEFPLTTEIFSSACTFKNLKVVKRLIQMVNEKGISIDLTTPFLSAISSHSEEIIKLFLEQKVDINYNKLFDMLNDISKDEPEIIYLLINEIKPEQKSILINESFKAALLTNNVEILKFLMTNKYEFDDLLIKAVEFSNLEVIKTILEFNYSIEFINKIGEFGTALFQAVKNMSNFTNNNHFSYPSNKEEIEKQKIQIIEYLLSQKGIDPSISVDSINTPLVEAVKINNIEAVRLILNFYGDNIKEQGKQVHDALHVILEDQSERIKKQTKKEDKQFGILSKDVSKEQMIFNMLLNVRKLACVNMQEDVLFYAILENESEIVENLLNDKSIDVGQIINNGDTYFHLSINGNSVTPIQRLLLNHPSIDINYSNALKETPLVKAVKCENKELVELILKHPKFDSSLSLLNYAFMLSVKSKEILMLLIKVDSLDVNYMHMDQKIEQNNNNNNYYYGMMEDNKKRKETFTTALIEATKIGDLEIIKAIIGHPSFDPIKSQITSCPFLAIQNKNLIIFKYFIEINKNNGDINLKNTNNESLLFSAAATGNNSEILNEILNNEKFDPIKSDILGSFMNSSDTESMKILLAYDEKHGSHHISFDKIYLLQSDLYHHNRIKKGQNAIEFLLRKEGIFPILPSICTSIIAKNHRVYQQTYICKTCGTNQSICEICAKVCHKGHKIVLNEDNFQSNLPCCCGKNCKCKSIVKSLHEELYDKLNLIENEKTTKPHYYYQQNTDRNTHFDEDEDENEEDKFKLNRFNKYYCSNLREGEEEEEEEENNEEEIKSLKCTFDLAGFHSMSQPMYRCRKCKVDICQTCAILCHKDHPLNFKGFKSDASCHCFEMIDCQCTSRKDVVCSYAFYGKDFIYQTRYKCGNCLDTDHVGLCIACAKKCHHNHLIYYNGVLDHLCDCGAQKSYTHCKALKFPPFNYLSSCTNREQKYNLTKQRLYHCKTCGLTAKNQGICEACALLCHLGHNVVYVGVSEFVCECATLNECVAPSCPEISCDGICSRKKDTKDKIFPAFVCLSCDKDGKNKLCKSCALNCHKGHDVHFLQYSNFVCQCDPCKCNE